LPGLPPDQRKDLSVCGECPSSLDVLSARRRPLRFSKYNSGCSVGFHVLRDQCCFLALSYSTEILAAPSTSLRIRETRRSRQLAGLELRSGTRQSRPKAKAHDIFVPVNSRAARIFETCEQRKSGICRKRFHRNFCQRSALSWKCQVLRRRKHLRTLSVYRLAGFFVESTYAVCAF
jgi:hypothetical protein